MRQKNGKYLECKTCRKEIYRSLSQIKDDNYCSKKCHYNTVVKNCEVCGGEIKAKKGSQDRKRFCSRKCVGINAAKNKSFIENRNTIAWNKGIKLPYPVWNKGIPFPQISGENNNKWKGGITATNNKIRTSLEYKIWRRSVFERDGYTCVWCNDKGGWSKEKNKTIVLNADHIKPFAKYPEHRFDLDNGRTLCHDCHKTTDTYGTNGNTN